MEEGRSSAEMEEVRDHRRHHHLLKVGLRRDGMVISGARARAKETSLKWGEESGVKGLCIIVKKKRRDERQE